MDLAKLKELYQPGTDDFVLVDVPEMTFAVIDGQGSPEGGAAKAAIKDIFTAIYPIRREARKRHGSRFLEPPVEMIYWADDMRDLANGVKENWKWRVMVVLPTFVDEAMFREATDQAKDHMDDMPASLRMEPFEEGLCAQIKHIGALEEIPALLDRLYTDFLPEEGLEPSGAYHEIYLDDWSRVAPAKRKIVLRQPVRACKAS